MFQFDDEFFTGSSFREENGIPHVAEFSEIALQAKQAGKLIEKRFCFELTGFIDRIEAGIADARGNQFGAEPGISRKGIVATIDIKGNQHIAQVEEDGTDHSFYYGRKTVDLCCRGVQKKMRKKVELFCPKLASFRALPSGGGVYNAPLY